MQGSLASNIGYFVAVLLATSLVHGSWTGQPQCRLLYNVAQTEFLRTAGYCKAECKIFCECLDRLKCGDKGYFSQQTVSRSAITGVISQRASGNAAPSFFSLNPGILWVAP